MKKFLCCTLIILLLLPLVSCSFNAPFDITMPYSSFEYENGEWTAETLIKHFEELGFHNIETASHPSYFGDYTDEIISVEIEIESDSIFTEYASFEKGEVVNSIDKVYISYYYVPDALTIDECPELAEVLLGSKNDELMDYMTFANKYDGKYVRFDACVYSHSTYDGGTSHVITVVGGDDASSDGYIIHIGNRTWGNQIDESVEEGQLVRVYGKIDASWCEYWKTVYIETKALEPR